MIAALLHKTGLLQNHIPELIIELSYSVSALIGYAGYLAGN